MKLDILAKAGEVAGIAGGKIVKHAPRIFMVAGLGCIGTGTVLACKATLKTRDEFVQEHMDISEDNDAEAAKQLTVKHLSTALRNYALPISLIVGGTFMVVKGHSIQEKRLIGAIAAYNAVDAGFQKYRERVIENEGKEKDREYLYGIKTETESESYTDENGKKKKKKVHYESIDPDDLSVYARCFDQFNSDEWRNDPVYNQAFLKGVQAVFNNILQVKGYVFLNDVYKELGFKEVPMGQAVGWIKGLGDDCIDFGIYDARNRKALEFRNGSENCIWLDFNVDGIIWDKI